MSLQGILLFVFVGVSMLFALAAICMAAVFLVMLSGFEQMRRRTPSSAPEFLRKLLRGLSRDAFQQIGTVHQAYRAFFGVGSLRSSHLEEISGFLEQAIRRIPAAPEGPPAGPAQAQLALLRELLAANQRALEVERMCVPFSGTPELERGILGDLLELPMEDRPKLTAKLDELARAIRFRQDALDRLEGESARSLKVARWGWYGVLSLGILTGILGFLCLGL